MNLIEGIVSFDFCRILDLSFNRITEIKNLEKLVKLQKLYLCANKLTKIENLETLTNLTMLELGDNRFRVSVDKTKPSDILTRQAL